MPRSVNKVILVGNVGSDPEVKTTGNGNTVASFSLATSWKRGDEEKTDWHRVSCFGKTAEIVEQYVSKGDRLYVEGRISYRQWENDEGEKRYFTDINAFEVVMLGGSSPSGGHGGGGKAQKVAPKKKENIFDDEDDDLPF